MKNSLIVFFAGILLVSCLSTNKGDSEKKNIATSEHSRGIDTINISDSSYQIVEYFESGIHSINFMSKSKTSDVSTQEIIFHSNGVVKSIDMINGSKIIVNGNSKQYVYQNNYISFSENGRLKTSKFMDDFRIISEYK